MLLESAMSRSSKQIKRRLLSAATLPLFLAVCGRADACLWDRDTLAEEAVKFPNLVEVITGRFDRNPPLFYEMRLKRVTDELRSFPNDLEKYDDAAVACDRLGRDDEAIAFMDKKRAILEKADRSQSAVKENWYRYNANVGTFWVHRWFRHGADRSKLDEVRKARGYIAEALKLNPHAHFGRERVQLAVMDWIIDPKVNEVGLNGNSSRLSKCLFNISREDRVRGLSGLIVLGNAWESVDVFEALAQALRGRETLAYLSMLRCTELIEKGGRSLLPYTPTGKDLEISLRLDQVALFASDKQEIEEQYKALRAEAEERNKKRDDYAIAEMKRGNHPDTDPLFWHNFYDPPPPSLNLPFPKLVAHKLRGDGWLVLVILVSGGGLVLAAVWKAVKWTRARAKRRPPPRASGKAGLY